MKILPATTADLAEYRSYPEGSRGAAQWNAEEYLDLRLRRGRHGPVHRRIFGLA